MGKPKIEMLVLSIAANQFTVPLPTGAEVIRAVNSHDALLSAAKKVLVGLDARIKAADGNGMSVPVFDGIGELHDAINLAESGAERPVCRGGER